MADPLLRISVWSDLNKATRVLDALQRKQLPFATATMLTSLAKIAQAEEKKALPHIFDRPTPFTINSIGIKAARKSAPEAMVFVKDIAAAYLEPYEVGGTHMMIGSGKTWLNPKDKLLLNKYGNFSASTLARLKARPDIFVGTIKTKSGEQIGGVWQRPAPTKVIQSPGKRTAKVRGANQSGHLKLLVRFGDPRPVRQHLDFGKRAAAVVNKHVAIEFAKALTKAMATAKR